MVEETENLVLILLREIRKEQADQRSVLLGVVDQMRRMDDDMRGLRDGMGGLRGDMGGLRDDMRRMSSASKRGFRPSETASS